LWRYEEGDTVLTILSARRAIALCVVALLLAACQGTAAPGASSSGSPSPAASSAPSSGPKAIKDGPLPPGDYTAVSFAVPLKFTIAAHFGETDWQVYDTNLRSVLFLAHGEGSGVLFLVPSKAYDPVDGSLQPLPDDLVVWLTAHPGLEVTNQGSEGIGGIAATWLDVKVKGTPSNALCGGGGTPGVPLVTSDEVKQTFLTSVCLGYPRRLYVLKVSGTPLFVDVIDSGILADARELLATMTFIQP
jgi:hypothetical protein